MTKQQAMQEIRSGNKMTHESFPANKFIKLEGKKIADENGYLLEPHIFWSYKQETKFNTGWIVYQNII